MAITLTPTALDDVLAFTIGVAREAGAIILEGSVQIRTAAGAQEKKNSVDLVTEYDIRVEELVRARVKETYPDYGFIGEESYSAGARPALTDAPTFCVDPIDGTTNFIHGFPFSCISLGLIHQRRPVLGVIYNPFLDHLYTAAEGKGSYLSDHGAAPQKLPLASPPRPLPSLHEALISVEWGSDRRAPVIAAKARAFSRLAGDPAEGVVGGRMAHSLRSTGSAALQFAMVAQGGLDLYWEIGCWPWDVCAGIVIAQEAGGVVVGSHTALDQGKFGEVTEDVLYGRKYVVVRAIGDTEGETGRQAQERIVRELYESVEDFGTN